MHRTDGGALPVVLVTGATGTQGGSVVRHLLERGHFTVRALTRSPRSAEAERLRALGAEVVRGDLYDLGSVRAAIAGCYGVFGVTNYWEHFEREYEHGINIVNAAADAGAGHVVLSTLQPVGRLTGGALHVPHFDLKADVEAYARSLRLPATFVQAAWYFENVLHRFTPRRQPDGSYAFALPQGDARLPGVAADDIGRTVACIFERPASFIGRTIEVVGDVRTGNEYAAIMARVSGRRIAYRAVPPHEFAAYAFPGAAALAGEFAFYRARNGDVAIGNDDGMPGLQDFASWLEQRRDDFALALEA